MQRHVVPFKSILRHSADFCAVFYIRGCRFLYVEGIQTVRIGKRLKKRTVSALRPAATAAGRFCSITVGKQLRGLRLELRSIRTGFSNLRVVFSHTRHTGLLQALEEYFRFTHRGIRVHREFLSSVINFTVPVASVIFLVITVHHWNAMNFGLILTNSGQQIAAIQNESVYEKATEMVNQRMVHDTAQESSGIKFAPSFRLTADSTGYLTPNAVCDLLIKQSNGIIEEASGLYVDGRLLGAVKSGADLRYILDGVLNSARGSDTSAKVQFTKNVEIVNGLFPTMSIVGTDSMKKLVDGTSKATTTYTVRQGDTATSIANANHTTVAELNKINHNQLGDMLHPGDLINLELAVPTLEVELVKTVTYDVAISYPTVTREDSTQYTDYTKVITEGVNGKQHMTDQIHTVNGVETSRVNISATVLQQPVTKVVLTGTKKKPQNEAGVASGTFMWPVPSLHTITTYFTWRWGVFHTGIDISGSDATGRTIVAADGGVVTMAGPNDGYGNCIIIDHGNGYCTLYGHCSKILVSEGQSVSKGQAIGRVGSTGNATGPHCHFEVIKNNTKVNPLLYVS